MPPFCPGIWEPDQHEAPFLPTLNPDLYVFFILSLPASLPPSLPSFLPSLPPFFPLSVYVPLDIFPSVSSFVFDTSCYLLPVSQLSLPGFNSSSWLQHEVLI